MSDLENLLKINNLANYFKSFAKQNINSINDFKGLYYTDLEKLGITDIKSRRLIYDLICEVNEKTYEKSFLTEILLTKENNYVNAENQKSMNEQEIANTSKLVDLKYNNKHMNETKESNSRLLQNERNCVETTVQQPASSSTQEDLNKSIYEARYGDRIDSTINNEEVNKIPTNDTFINYTNLFYNSSHIPQSPALKKDRTLISSIFNKKSDTKVTKEIAQYSVQLVENVSCDLLQKIKLSDNSMQRIIVCVRKKPVNKGEKDVVECERQSINVREIKTNYDLTKKVHCHTFNYDFAYDENAKNDDLYKDISHITEHVINGGNGSVIAYGQTGTGKTHTILHPENGLVFLGLREFLNRGKQIYISFFEIYNGQLYDLLDYRENVIVREKNNGVYIQNITERKINTFEEGRMVINDGMSIRRRGVTGANIESSRSHAVLKIALDKDSNTNEGNCMLFVDLAGSERGNDRKNSDDYTKNEGAEINKSLLALKECIRSLVNSESHLPFRHTKLTQILKNSFIGNGMTCLVATINPSGSCIEHTLNTLKYANRVKDIKPSGKLRLHIQSNEKTDGSISKSVTQLSNYFDKKVDGKRNTNIDDFGHKSVHSSSLGRDSTNESRYMSTIARRNVTDANLVVLLNKKIENTTKIIVKQCSTSTDIRMLKRTSDYLKRIETKINEMKFS